MISMFTSTKVTLCSTPTPRIPDILSLCAFVDMIWIYTVHHIAMMLCLIALPYRTTKSLL